MKNFPISIFCLLVLLLFYSNGFTQQNQRDNCYFLLGNTQIVLSNNFIRQINGPGYAPQFVSPPFKDYTFKVYGEKLILKMLNTKITPYVTGSGVFIDSAIANPLYKFETLEFFIKKNDTVISDWKRVIKALKYIDSSAYFLKNQGFKNVSPVLTPGLILFNNQLSDNDSVYISFRQPGKMPFLNVLLKKRFADNAPYKMGSLMRHDLNFPLSTFVKNALEEERTFNNNGFYNDRPGEEKGLEKIFPDSKLAIFFRRRNDINNDSAFEYRIFEKNKLIEDWKKSGNIIFFTSFKPGRRYRLEIRYTDRPAKFYTQYIDVAPVWYQNKWVDVAIGAISVLLLSIAYLIAKNIRRRRKQNEQKIKLKALYSQLNPHFIFNALGSIQGLLNNNDIDNANRYLSDFGSLLRNSLVAGEKEMIPLSEDIQYLKKYVALEQLRFSFNCEWIIDEALNTNQIDVLPLLIQPIIENAIKHGLSAHDQNGILQIRIEKVDNSMIYKISDNGKGFNSNATFKGRGLRLVNERIKLFNQSSGQKKIDLKINSGMQGTIATMILSNWLE